MKCKLSGFCWWQEQRKSFIITSCTQCCKVCLRCSRCARLSQSIEAGYFTFTLYLQLHYYVHCSLHYVCLCYLAA